MIGLEVSGGSHWEVPTTKDFFRSSWGRSCWKQWLLTTYRYRISAHLHRNEPLVAHFEQLCHCVPLLRKRNPLGAGAMTDGFLDDLWHTSHSKSRRLLGSFFLFLRRSLGERPIRKPARAPSKHRTFEQWTVQWFWCFDCSMILRFYFDVSIVPWFLTSRRFTGVIFWRFNDSASRRFNASISIFTIERFDVSTAQFKGIECRAQGIFAREEKTCARTTEANVDAAFFFCRGISPWAGRYSSCVYLDKTASRAGKTSTQLCPAWPFEKAPCGN